MNAFEQHEKWLTSKGKDGKQANLNGASLFGVNLAGRDLTDAVLSNCDMSQANLEGANLTNCNLRGTTLTGAKLAQANLTRADLTDATCRGANCQMANFTLAVCRGTDFFGADLKRSSIDKAASLQFANFSKAIMDKSLIAFVEETPETRIDQPSMRDQTETTGRGATAGLPGEGGQNRNVTVPAIGEPIRNRGRGGRNRGEDSSTVKGDTEVQVKPAPEGKKVKVKSTAPPRKKRKV